MMDVQCGSSFSTVCENKINAECHFFSHIVLDVDCNYIRFFHPYSIFNISILYIVLSFISMFEF